ncbi:MAG: aminotransferase class III-fold pyridoxal phosphate-dependent enzyme, partial [Proteobacteria bacterium]|nr:aminotransferase class III-fold pyridoxal phosphate-dependent enzyme [Pseudomonadota bacterium]
DYGWLIELKNALHSLGCLLIFDEVYTGVGRTGVMFRATEVIPDILCLGKALGGGMPLSCVAAPAKIMASWPKNLGESLHTGTYFGHALSCLVAQKNLEIMKRDRLASRAHELGKAWLDRYLQHKKKNRLGSVRVYGLMIAIDLQTPSGGVELAQYLRSHNIIAVPCGVNGECLSITPALNIDEELLWHSLVVIGGALERCDR